MYQLWLDSVEESDIDLAAHLATGDADEVEPEMYANVAGAGGDDGSDAEDFEHGDSTN